MIHSNCDPSQFICLMICIIVHIFKEWYDMIQFTYKQIPNNFPDLYAKKHKFCICNVATGCQAVTDCSTFTVTIVWNSMISQPWRRSCIAICIISWSKCIFTSLFCVIRKGVSISNYHLKNKHHDPKSLILIDVKSLNLYQLFQLALDFWWHIVW